MLHSIVFDAVEIRRENRQHAVANARQAAQLLESDRVATLRDDLMRRLRENKEERARIDAALDELDALRVLETAS